MKKYAVIVAAGSGSRMGSDMPKQFMMLHGLPVYTYAIRVFLNAFSDLQVLLVIPEHYDFDDTTLQQYFPGSSNIHIVRGGASRFQSVKNALQTIREEGIVFIHDSVRPLIHVDFLQGLLLSAIEHGHAVPCVDINDSLRKIAGDENEPVDRSFFKAIQTPQVFQLSQIKKAYEQEFSERFTDDATVLEGIGEKINLVDGLKENIKITRPSDLIVVSALLNLLNK